MFTLSESERADEVEVSMALVKDMLKAQETNLKTLFKLMIDSFSTRLDDVVNTVASLQASLEFSQNELRELHPLRSRLTDVTKEVYQIKGDFAQCS